MIVLLGVTASPGTAGTITITVPDPPLAGPGAIAGLRSAVYGPASDQADRTNLVFQG